MTLNEWAKANKDFINLGTIVVAVTKKKSLKRDDVMFTTYTNLDNAVEMFGDLYLTLIKIEQAEESKLKNNAYAHAYFLLYKNPPEEKVF